MTSKPMKKKHDDQNQNQNHQQVTMSTRRKNHRLRQQANRLTWEKNPSAELARLSWPICISLLSYSLMTLVDTLFVGRLGTAALAGVGVGGVVAFTLLCFPMGVLRGGVKVVIAQVVGAGERERATAILGAGLVLATGLSALSVAAFAVATFFLPDLLGGEGGKNAQIYLLVRAMGAPLFLWAVAIREARYGLGDSRSPMVAAVAANAVNIALDALFIFGLGSGVEGAALASVIAQGVEAALLFGVQIKQGLGLLQVRWAQLRAVLRLGLPTGAQAMIEVSAFALITILLARHSELDAAAHQIGLQVVHFAFLPALAVGDAAGVLAGQAVGAGRLRLVLVIGHRALIAVSVYAALCTVLLLLVATPLAGAFTTDQALMEKAADLLIIAGLFLIADGAQIVARCVLRATGDVYAVAVLSVGCAWLITPPLTWWLGLELGWGAAGAWIGLTAEIFAIAVILWWRFEKIGWRKAAFTSRRELARDRTPPGPPGA